MHKVLARQIKKLGLLPDLETAPSVAQWRQFVATIDRVYTDADQDRYTLERALDLSSAEMQKRFAELRSTQGKLLEASRKAGMADVATNLIHNVGNVLNSLNVSSGVVGRLVSTSTLAAGLERGLDLLKSQPQPGRFLDEDPRGKKLLDYLGNVVTGMREQRAEILAELESLTKNIEHIKAIISVQQSHARARGVTERVLVSELLDDGIKFLTLSDSDAKMSVIQDYDRSLTITVDRHKLFQILVNLLSNARHALAQGEERPTVTLRAMRVGDDRVCIQVEDNGVGIPEENLARVFNHGFTTKVEGHGFGLHSSSCFAIELGGKLTVHSDGPGSGAKFTLIVPINANTVVNSAHVSARGPLS